VSWDLALMSIDVLAASVLDSALGEENIEIVSRGQSVVKYGGVKCVE